MPPKVTVCIPTYNYAAFLPEAIDSVLAQTYRNFELLIIDDCSTDDTAQILAEYGRRDSRIVYRVQTQNRGMVANWNLCLASARGEYVQLLMADDLLCSEDALGEMVAALESDPSVSLVASARHLVDADSRIIKTRCHYRTDRVLNGGAVMSHCLFKQRNLIGEPSVVMFRRAQATRGFNEEYRQLVDLEMWFHLLGQGALSYLSRPLCAFRVHGAQQTAMNQKEAVTYRELGFLSRDYLDRCCVRINRFARGWIRYEQQYRLWQLARKGMVPMELACSLIAQSYGMGRFKLLFPLYKALKPLLKGFDAVDAAWYSRLASGTGGGK